MSSPRSVNRIAPTSSMFVAFGEDESRIRQQLTQRLTSQS